MAAVVTTGALASFFRGPRSCHGNRLEVRLRNDPFYPYSKGGKAETLRAALGPPRPGPTQDPCQTPEEQDLPPGLQALPPPSLLLLTKLSTALRPHPGPRLLISPTCMAGGGGLGRWWGSILATSYPFCCWLGTLIASASSMEFQSTILGQQKKARSGRLDTVRHSEPRGRPDNKQRRLASGHTNNTNS